MNKDLEMAKDSDSSLNSLVETIMYERIIKDGIGISSNDKFIKQKPTPRQKLFLALKDKKEVFYGGAAGGGKSSALLMAALEYVDVPNYAALLIRRTYTDLAKPGALIPRSHEWLNNLAHWNDQTKTWTFPSGATLSFGHLESENDKYKYQSSEFQFIGFDELSQFTETQYTYLFSRLRRLKNSKIPIRMRAGSNPGGVGGYWLKKRFIPDNFTTEDAKEEKVWEKVTPDDETGQNIIRYFVPALMDDNPHLDQTEYEYSLRELDPITRAQLRRGDWQISLRGDVLHNWDEKYLVISWSQFAKVFGEPRIPLTWPIGVFQDWGATEGHPCVTGWYAIANANAPVADGISLANSVFFFREMTVTRSTALELKKMIQHKMSKDNEMQRTRAWQMSHEALSERLEYNMKSDGADFSLPFTNWETGATRGVEQLKRAITPRYLDRDHPFKEGVKGRPTLYLIVDDDELSYPKSDAGLVRIRSEAPTIKWQMPKSGEPPRKLAIDPIFNDSFDQLRAAAASFFPNYDDLESEILVATRARAMLGFNPDTEKLTPGRQLAIAIANGRARREIDGDDEAEFLKPW